MELNKNDAAVRATSINPLTGPIADEIDLYDELTAFAKLSPEEQVRLVAPPKSEPAETVDAEEHASPEPVLTHPPIEPVESETASAALVAAPSPVSVGEHISPKPVLARPPIEPVESDETVPTIESSHEVPNPYVEPNGVRPRPVEGPRPSGPLSGFNLPPDIVYMGALSPGVCVACGAESGADDLFCVTCGVFIDEIGSTLSFDSKCAECKREIVEDEIFCPWCGSVLPA